MRFDKSKHNQNHKRWEMRDEAQNTNSQLCAECGGECCKGCGCYYSPEDFPKITYNALKKEIQKGLISIEMINVSIFNMTGGIYILRMRNRERPIVDDGQERSPCVLWDEKSGCSLAYCDRPMGGKLLIPRRRYCPISKKEELTCYNKYDLETCCDEWRKYQTILKKLVKCFQ